ncbi:MAG: hypothetical protein IH851_01090 [Armatimonadetes bacterium]|nr:hypothetical protein [Armatimonadota bacterium]
MPVYDYICESCGRRFTALIGVTAEPDDEGCPGCGSGRTRRLIGRIARVRSEDQRLEDAADRLEGMPEPDSYSEIRKTMREVGSALDDGVADEMEETFEAEMEESGE